jgi:hypothetical protein
MPVRTTRLTCNGLGRTDAREDGLRPMGDLTTDESGLRRKNDMGAI